MSETIQAPSIVETYPMGFEDMPPVIREACQTALDEEYEQDVTHMIEDVARLQFEGIDSCRIHVPMVERSALRGYGRATTFFLDISPEGETLGLGLLVHAEDVDKQVPQRMRKPYVGYTETDEGHLREGLGIRRLRLMNEQALERYGEPLHSDPSGNTEPEASAVWLKLVEQSEAEYFKDEGVPRFRFTSTD